MGNLNCSISAEIEKAGGSKIDT